MKAIQIGSLGIFLAIVVAALGITFFRTVDGSNLRSLIRDKQALGQQVISLQSSVGERDARISKLGQYIDTLE